jgi:hydrogenase maturation protease
MKTLVVGLGNPILGDDGVGWKVAEEVQKQLPPDQPVEVDCVSLGGLSLMEHLIGYDNAIIVDSFISDEDVGAIRISKLCELRNYSAYHIGSAHDTSLQSAIELGKSMGAQLPQNIMVVGVGINRIYDFSEELSPLIAEAIPWMAHIVLDLIKQPKR